MNHQICRRRDLLVGAVTAVLAKPLSAPAQSPPGAAFEHQRGTPEMFAIDEHAVAHSIPTSAPALFRRFPQLHRRLPWMPLIARPTPCHRLERLSRHVGAEIWIKRDDLTSPLYGGNKARKNEFLFSDLRASGRNAVLTMGGIGSHHCCSVAATARTLGWETMLVQFPQPVTPHVRQMLRWQQLWRPARTLARAEWTLPFAVLRGWNRLERAPATRPGLIWMGGSSPYGTLGYVDAALEFAEQVRCGNAPRPGAIFVAAGSGGTLAGLLAGFRLAQFDVPVVGVQIVPTPAITRLSVAWLANAALDRIATAAPDEIALPDIDRSDVVLDDRFLGQGYGFPTDDGRHAIELFATFEGISLEDTYTAKTAAAMLSAAREKERGGPLLFWNTFNSAPPPPLPPWQELPREYHRFFTT